MNKSTVSSANIASFRNTLGTPVFSANGATYHSPGLDAHPELQALKGRQKSPAPTGRFIVAQGNALGNRPFIRKALIGRSNSQRLEVAP